MPLGCHITSLEECLHNVLGSVLLPTGSFDVTRCCAWILVHFHMQQMSPNENFWLAKLLFEITLWRNWNLQSAKSLAEERNSISQSLPSKQLWPTMVRKRPNSGSRSTLSPSVKMNWDLRSFLQASTMAICWAATDSTGSSMRLNSSKQPQEPDWARPVGTHKHVYSNYPPQILVRWQAENSTHINCASSSCKWKYSHAVSTCEFSELLRRREGGRGRREREREREKDRDDLIVFVLGSNNGHNFKTQLWLPWQNQLMNLTRVNAFLQTCCIN